jgi:hypothetical protein
VSDQAPAFRRSRTCACRRLCAGLRDEGCETPTETVQRAHALLMLLFSGFTAIPFEHLGLPPTAELRRIAHERATSLRFVLDLVEASTPAARPT